MNTPNVIEALSALAHEHRLRVYRLLVEQGPEGSSAGTIAGRLDLAPSSLTFHLQRLHRAGLITQRRDSRQLFYAADFSAMGELVGYLTENCCGGQSCAPAASCEPTTAKGEKHEKTSRARRRA